MSKQAKRAWDMLLQGDELEIVRQATGLSTSLLEAIRKDINNYRKTKKDNNWASVEEKENERK